MTGIKQGDCLQKPFGIETLTSMGYHPKMLLVN